MNIKVGDGIKFRQDNEYLIGTVVERFYAGYDETLRLRVNYRRSNSHGSHNIDISINDVDSLILPCYKSKSNL